MAGASEMQGRDDGATRAARRFLASAPALASTGPDAGSERVLASLREILRRVAASPRRSAFDALREVRSFYEKQDEGALKAAVRRLVRESFRSELVRLRADRFRFERFVMGTVVALSGTDLVAGEDVERATRDVLGPPEEGAPSDPAARLLASALSRNESPRAAEPDAPFRRQLESCLSELASAEDSEQARASENARRAYAIVSVLRPALAPRIAKRSFDRATRTALAEGGIAKLQKVALLLALALKGTSALSESALARIVLARRSGAPSPGDADEVELPADGAETLADELAERFHVAPAKIERLASLAPDKTAFLDRLSSVQASRAPALLDRLVETVDRLDRRQVLFDDRFRILDALFPGDLSEDWDPLAARLGRGMFLVQSVGELNMDPGSLELVAGAEAESSFGGISGGSFFSGLEKEARPSAAQEQWQRALEAAAERQYEQKVAEQARAFGAGGAAFESFVASVRGGAGSGAFASVSFPGSFAVPSGGSLPSIAALARSFASSGALGAVHGIAEAASGRSLGSIGHIALGYQSMFLDRHAMQSWPASFSLSSAFSSPSPRASLLLPFLARATATEPVRSYLPAGGGLSRAFSSGENRALASIFQSSGFAPSWGGFSGSRAFPSFFGTSGFAPSAGGPLSSDERSALATFFRGPGFAPSRGGFPGGGGALPSSFRSSGFAPSWAGFAAGASGSLASLFRSAGLGPGSVSSGDRRALESFFRSSPSAPSFGGRLSGSERGAFEALFRGSAFAPTFGGGFSFPASGSFPAPSIFTSRPAFREGSSSFPTVSSSWTLPLLAQAFSQGSVARSIGSGYSPRSAPVPSALAGAFPWSARPRGFEKLSPGSFEANRTFASLWSSLRSSLPSYGPLHGILQDGFGRAHVGNLGSARFFASGAPSSFGVGGARSGTSFDGRGFATDFPSSFPFPSSGTGAGSRSGPGSFPSSGFPASFAWPREMSAAALTRLFPGSGLSWRPSFSAPHASLGTPSSSALGGFEWLRPPGVAAYVLGRASQAPGVSFGSVRSTGSSPGFARFPEDLRELRSWFASSGAGFGPFGLSAPYDGSPGLRSGWPSQLGLVPGITSPHVGAALSFHDFPGFRESRSYQGRFDFPASFTSGGFPRPGGSWLLPGARAAQALELPPFVFEGGRASSTFLEGLPRPDGSRSFAARSSSASPGAFRFDGGPGLDLSRILFGFLRSGSPAGSRSALALGTSAFAGPGFSGTTSPRWFDIARTELSRPVLGLSEIASLGGFPLGSAGARSVFDLAWTSSAPRVLPGLGARAGPGSVPPLSGGRSSWESIFSAGGTRWQDLARLDLDLHSPLFAFRQGGDAAHGTSSGWSQGFTGLELLDLFSGRGGPVPSTRLPSDARSPRADSGLGLRPGRSPLYPIGEPDRAFFSALVRGMRGGEPVFSLAHARDLGRMRFEASEPSFGLGDSPAFARFAEGFLESFFHAQRGASAPAFPGDVSRGAQVHPLASGSRLGPFASGSRLGPFASGSRPGPFATERALPSFLPGDFRRAYERAFGLDLARDAFPFPGSSRGSRLGAYPSLSPERLGISFAQGLLGHESGLETVAASKLDLPMTYLDTGQRISVTQGAGTRPVPSSPARRPRVDLGFPGVFFGKGESRLTSKIGSEGAELPDFLTRLLTSGRSSGPVTRAARREHDRLLGSELPSSRGSTSRGPGPPRREGANARSSRFASEPGGLASSGLELLGRVESPRSGFGFPGPAELVRSSTGLSVRGESRRVGEGRQRALERVQARRGDVRSRGFARERPGDRRAGAASPWAEAKFDLAYTRSRGALARGVGSDRGAPLSRFQEHALATGSGADLASARLQEASLAVPGAGSSGAFGFSRGGDVPAARGRSPGGQAHPSHELAHVFPSPVGRGTGAERAPDRRAPAGRPDPRKHPAPWERASRDAQLPGSERPELEMEHTEVVPRVQREVSPYEHVDQVTTGGSTDAAVEQSHMAEPPDADMNPLIYQLYARIKRELLIERERKGGLY